MREHFSFFDFDLYIITYGCVKLDNAPKRGSNERSCRKKGRLWLELVNGNCKDWFDNPKEALKAVRILVTEAAREEEEDNDFFTLAN